MLPTRVLIRRWFGSSFISRQKEQVCVRFPDSCTMFPTRWGSFGTMMSDIFVIRVGPWEHHRRHFTAPQAMKCARVIGSMMIARTVSLPVHASGSLKVLNIVTDGKMKHFCRGRSRTLRGFLQKQ